MAPDDEVDNTKHETREFNGMVYRAVCAFTAAMVIIALGINVQGHGSGGFPKKCYRVCSRS